MINNFEEEVLKSEKPVLLRFSLEKGCGFCDNYKPIFEAFENKHSDIKCITLYKEDIRTPQTELEIQFGINSYPATLAFIDGELVNTETGIRNEKQLLEMLKTIKNVSDLELQQGALTLEGESVELRKRLLQNDVAMMNVKNEMGRRMKLRNALKPLPINRPPVPTMGEDPAIETECEGCA